MEKRKKERNNKKLRIAMLCFAILNLILIFITLVLENLNNQDVMFLVFVLTLVILSSLLILLVYFIFAEGNRALGIIFNKSNSKKPSPLRHHKNN